MSWIPGVWMGLFWVGLGIFILVSSWMGKSSFYIPRLQINLGWVVIALGALRIWWWWKTEELPARRKKEARAEIRQMELEQERARMNAEHAAQGQTEEHTHTEASSTDDTSSSSETSDSQ